MIPGTSRVCASLAFAGVMAALALGPGAAPIRSSAQQTAPFRAGVEIVDVDVSVLDRFRRPVTGLTAADFRVLEDGKPRPIVAFTPVDLPARERPAAPWLVEVAPDAQSNDLQREGRLLVILLDRGIAFEDIPAARRIAEATIDQMRPADLAAVIYTDYGMPQNFTADRQRLLAAIHAPSAALPEGDSGEAAPCYCGTCTLERIDGIAEAVRDVRQRRKILFVISSNPRVTGRGSCGAALGDVRSRALRAIGAANLTVHVFDPSGVTTPVTSAATRAPSGRGSLAALQRLGNLRILPDHTGGRAVTRNQAEEVLPEIFRETNSYYVLGFTPAHTDGRFHNISVKVAGREVVLQARRGYVAAGGTSRAPAGPALSGAAGRLQQAIAGLWPRTTLPLTMTAVPMASPGLRSATVVMTLSFPATPVTDAPVVNVLAGAFDRNGRALATEQGTATLGPPAADAERTTHDVIARLELKPGRYEIRAAVENPATGEIGSVYSYVDVPDYLAQFLSLSGVVLTTNPQPAAAVLNAAEPPLGPRPTPRRRFSRSEKVSAWFQIYQGLRRPAMPGYLVVEIRDQTDRRVFRQETRMLETDVGTNRAITEQFDLPVADLAPGQYLLAVDVRQGNYTATRNLRFAMR
jgi:VWFA-related protein